MAKNISEESIKNYIERLNKNGEEAFYRHLIAIGVKRSVNVKNPENEMMDMSESFLQLNRRTGEEVYAVFYRLFRRAAHTLYRQLDNKNSQKKSNNRFLHAV